MRVVAIISAGIFALALLVGAYVLWRPRAAGPTAAGRVIFRKAISSGRDITVLCGPTAGIAKLNGLLDPRAAANCSGVFPVWIELSDSSGEHLVLWSRLVLDFKDENAKGFAVLDLLPEGNGFVVATAEQSDVFLYRVHLPGSTEFCFLPHNTWSKDISVLPLDETSVRVVLRHSPDGKGVVAEVTDLRHADPRGTVVFKQVGDTWAFKP